MNIPPAVHEVVRRLQVNGWQAYVVGGCVRDHFLGRTPKDWDVATNAIPDVAFKIFKKVIPTGIKHGTVTVVQDGENIEVTTFRKDGDYTDGRHPDTVDFNATIEQDLARRDFTINAMAYDPIADKTVDPFGGMSDLRSCIIRAVGDPNARFTEDALRILRAVRFSAQLNFRIDGPTLNAIQKHAPLLAKVSAERRTAEFIKILGAPNPNPALQTLIDAQLMSFIIGSHAAIYKKLWVPPGAPLEIQLAVLFQDAYDGYMHRDQFEKQLRAMKLPGEVIKITMKLHGWYQEYNERATDYDVGDESLTPPELRRELHTYGPEYAPLMIKMFTHMGYSNPDKEYMVEYAKALESQLDKPYSFKQLALNGDSVQALLGQNPGPNVKKALNMLMMVVLEHPHLNTYDSLVAVLKGYMEDGAFRDPPV